MFTVKVRDHVMIAHSFEGDVFGPAQALHGATFVVDLSFRRADLSAANIVVDIGAATGLLKEILGKVNFRNLDDLPEFAGQNTTTEFLARWIHAEVSRELKAGRLGADGKAVRALCVELGESHIAWASYEGAVA